MFDLPSGKFEAFIFDCDGTLADSMPVHFRAWTEAFREAHPEIDFPEDFFYSLGGTPTAEVARINLDRFPGLTTMAPVELARRKENLFLQKLAAVRPVEPVVEFARRVKAEGKPVAVASGGDVAVVEATLGYLGLAGFFPVIVTPRDVARGKPAPDMFLLAAEKLGVAPERCLVFEDAPPGIEAARAAGMSWVWVRSRKAGDGPESRTFMIDVEGLGC
ncbi:MAG: HAD family phosphatase [Verrucomicrobiia bacterium]